MSATELESYLTPEEKRTVGLLLDVSKFVQQKLREQDVALTNTAGTTTDAVVLAAIAKRQKTLKSLLEASAASISDVVLLPGAAYASGNTALTVEAAELLVDLIRARADLILAPIREKAAAVGASGAIKGRR